MNHNTAMVLTIIVVTFIALATLFFCWWLFIQAKTKQFRTNLAELQQELLRSKWVCEGEVLDVVDDYLKVVDKTIMDIAEEIAIARGSKYKDTEVTYIQTCDVEQAILRMELGKDFGGCTQLMDEES